jgi:SpoVK/Ycf46/Vps4 family AAA+-type ATPase
MENAMQNIILQEMENLEGIMIATTNLTGNLDTAFERRFLYKVEFPKPTPNESKHIWHAMLPEISEMEAFELAKQYAFSGGQIENIARKQLVNAVLTGEDKVSMEAIKEACKTELFKNSSMKRIGFC